jgi:hypothetical protein
MQINGQNALQYDITGTLPNHTNVVYLHTVVEGKAGLHQILSWTIPTRKDAAFPVFQKTIASFREIKGAMPMPAVGQVNAPGSAPPTKAVTSSDGLVKLAVPANWTTRSDLVDGATIQMGDISANTFLVLQSYNKADIAGTFEKFADQSSAAIKANLKDGKRAPLGEQKVGGLPGVQYRLEGAAERFNLVYFVTYVEGKSSYHELLMWTISSNQASALETFHQILPTFQEISR